MTISFLLFNSSGLYSDEPVVTVKLLLLSEHVSGQRGVVVVVNDRAAAAATAAATTTSPKTDKSF